MRPNWRKSSYSGEPDIGTCVELAAVAGGRAIRDSKNPEGPVLTFSVAELRGLVTSIKSDELEL